MKDSRHNNCPCCVRYGGPVDTEEQCESCGKTWTRHRMGSWDWEYKDCSTCGAEKFVKDLNEKTSSK